MNPAEKAATEIYTRFDVINKVYNRGFIDDLTPIIQQEIDEMKTPMQIQAGFIGMGFVWHGSMLNTLKEIRSALAQEPTQ